MKIKNYTIHKLDPWWVTGITDAEGNFSINYNYKTNKYSFSYKVTQQIYSINILHSLKDYFGEGYIYIDNKKTKGYKYSVASIDICLSKIISHFDKYPLKSSKQLDYLSWKKAILIHKHNELNKSNSILYIKSQMNSKRSFQERWNYLKNLNIEINSKWLQAFIDGEGSFQTYISKQINSKSIIVKSTLEIAQHTHDVYLIKAILDFLGCGYLKPKYDLTKLSTSKKARSVTRVIVNENDVVIKFIDDNPMFTSKHLDYIDWKKIITMKSDSKHKTDEGLKEMIKIKLNMNKGRNHNLIS